MIYFKTEAEIEKMKVAGAMTAAVFEAVKPYIEVGVSTAEINRVVEETIRSQGAIPSFLGYGDPPFTGSACISINEEVVHGIPTSDRLLADGDIVSIDVGAYYDGFHGDACRTFCCGQVSEELRELVRTAEEAFWLAVREAQVGRRLGDISAAVQTHVEARGYGIVRELTGHGIGRHLHEDPDLLNYGKAGRGLRLQAGICLALEPMITLASPSIRLKSDGWTIVTRDGSAAAHYENSFAILETGPYVLTCPGYEQPLAPDFLPPPSLA